MGLEVKIESVPSSNEPFITAHLYALIEIPLRSDRLDLCAKSMRGYLETTAFKQYFAMGCTGEGGHIWVHERQRDGQICKDRLLIITEK